MNAPSIAMIRVSGTEQEMGRQHGELQRQLGGHEAVLDYYPRMPVHMLKGSQPAGPLRTMPGLIAPAIDALTRRLHAERPLQQRERSEAFMRALGLPISHARYGLAMDVFQNLVGVAGRIHLVPGARQVAAQALAACSSLAVWGKEAKGAELLHARNFDFPGNGIWDAVPTVVLCTPHQGLRYGYASARGNDAPVVSLRNEAGLCLTTHTRLHQQVRFGGAAVADLCHEIIRSASTLAQAEAIVRQRPVASTWGLLVSSASEQKAILIETTARAVAVTRPEGSFQACTNHYRASQLCDGELAPNSGYTAHSHGRLQRLERAVRETEGGLTAEQLQALLGDHEDGELAGLERGAGGVLAQPTGVHSIVMDPAARRCFVSTGGGSVRQRCLCRGALGLVARAGRGADGPGALYRASAQGQPLRRWARCCRVSAFLPRGAAGVPWRRASRDRGAHRPRSCRRPAGAYLAAAARRVRAAFWRPGRGGECTEQGPGA